MAQLAGKTLLMKLFIKIVFDKEPHADQHYSISKLSQLIHCAATELRCLRGRVENTFIDITILDALKDWKRQSQPNYAWANIRDFLIKLALNRPGNVK